VHESRKLRDRGLRDRRLRDRRLRRSACDGTVRMRSKWAWRARVAVHAFALFACLSQRILRDQGNANAVYQPAVSQSEAVDPQAALPSEPVSHATPLRIARSAGDWVSFQLHREALERFVPRGSRVLELSAGIGHYTEALHHLGCKITVLDESFDELESNQARARARGFAASVEGWAQRDVFSLGAFPDASFDVVVAYGAALSHALDRRDRALDECKRVLRPRGMLVLDVFSLWGSMRRDLAQLLARDLVLNRAIIRSGNAPESVVGGERRAPSSPVASPTAAVLTAAVPTAAMPAAASSPEAVPREPSSPEAVPREPSVPNHLRMEPPPRERHCHLFRAAELEAFLRRAGLEIVSLSASSALSTGAEMPMAADSGTWSALLEYERAACIERGYLDSGQHLIAIARR
jgi:SAM-dependent methyltransferase